MHGNVNNIFDKQEDTLIEYNQKKIKEKIKIAQIDIDKFVRLSHNQIQNYFQFVLSV